MRRNRLVLLVLWLLSLIGISLAGGEITYGIFFLLTLIPVVSALYIFIVTQLFKIYQNVEGTNLTANHPAVFSFVLQNESFVLFSGIRVLFYSSFSEISGLSDQTEYELLPHDGIRKKTDIVCHYRGEYEIGIRTIEITDFFRLFTFAYRNPEPKKVMVKPAVIHLSELKSFDLPQSSLRESRLNPTEADLTLREYVPGDDPRMIHWKATAAAEKLMVRERIGEQQEGISVLLDPHRYGTAMEDCLPLENKMLETLIAVNLFLSGKGIPVETYFLENGLQSCEINRGSGFDGLYERMSFYRFDTEYGMEHLYEEVMRKAAILNRQAVFLILHAWDAKAERFAGELNRHHVSVTAYAVTDDEVSFENDLSRTRVIRIPTDADLSGVM